MASGAGLRAEMAADFPQGEDKANRKLAALPAVLGALHCCGPPDRLSLPRSLLAFREDTWVLMDRISCWKVGLRPLSHTPRLLQALLGRCWGDGMHTDRCAEVPHSRFFRSSRQDRVLQSKIPEGLTPSSWRLLPLLTSRRAWKAWFFIEGKTCRFSCDSTPQGPGRRPCMAAIPHEPLPELDTGLCLCQC